MARPLVLPPSTFFSLSLFLSPLLHLCLERRSKSGAIFPAFELREGRRVLFVWERARARKKKGGCVCLRLSRGAILQLLNFHQQLSAKSQDALQKTIRKDEKLQARSTCLLLNLLKTNVRDGVSGEKQTA